MTIGTVVIIVVVLLMAIGPILWALPSRRERELAALRGDARKRGFSLQVTEIDHPSPDAEQQVSASGVRKRPMLGCVAYRLVRPPGAEEGASELATVVRSRVVRRQGANAAGLPRDWCIDAGFDGPDAAMLACISGLDADVLALESMRTSVAMFWTERGGPARLSALESSLRELMRVQQRDPPRDPHRAP